MWKPEKVTAMFKIFNVSHVGEDPISRVACEESPPRLYHKFLSFLSLSA